MGPGSCNRVQHTILTDAFKVVNAKDFEGMRPSSDLAKSLVSQGYPNMLKIKKGNAKTMALVAQGDGGYGDDEFEDNGAQAMRFGRGQHSSPGY